MTVEKLTATRVSKAPQGKYEDGRGLRLVKRSQKAGQWVLRITIHGRRREMGLGPWPEIGLAGARSAAAVARSQVAQGLDPIAQRERDRREAERSLTTFADVVADAFEARKAELKGDGMAGRWLSPINKHVLPKLGSVPIAQVDQVAIRDVLKPIWKAKPDTARKALNRITITLKHAVALGLVADISAPASARVLLGAQDHKATGIAALDWRDIARFWALLDEPTATHLALRLLILTAQRSAPVRLARVDDFDLDAAVWTIPGEVQKGRKGATDAIRVPLSPQAVEVVRAALPLSRNGNLFVSLHGKPLSDMAMSKRMRDLGETARPHGFRSAFRSWAEETGCAWNVAERILGHVVGDVVERSYQRADLLDQRRAMLDRWGDVCVGATADVVHLGRLGTR
ncbi:MAG: tyrosine-type recombinase/integrase [Shimia sp.]